MKVLRIPATAFLAVVIFSGTATAQVLDLADIVGGGDGTGTGTDSGIDVGTGAPTASHATLITSPTNVFTPSSNPLVDGVFIPDGGVGGSTVITVSSTGTTVTGVSDSTGFGSNPSQNTWDHIWNGHNTQTSSTLTGSVLGVHANKGITFDLDAIEAANSGKQVVSANLIAAMGTNSGSFGSADYYAFIDGVQVATTSLAAQDVFVDFGSIPVSPGDSYLTLITSSNGTIQSDWSFWLDSTVTLVPEPTTGAMAAISLTFFMVTSRKRKLAS